MIFLTANDQESDQIRGYEVGAVDYITKPFVIRALQRKIKAMFAMLEHHKPAKDIYDDGRLFLDFSEQTASLNGKPLTLSPMEYKMLNLFRKNPRQVQMCIRDRCSDVGGRNQVSLRVRSRRPGGEFGGYTALESGVEKVLPGFSPLLSYELELSAEDLPGSRRTVVCAISTAAAAVHLASGGTAVGVGKYAEHERAVEVNPEWEVYVLSLIHI